MHDSKVLAEHLKQGTDEKDDECQLPVCQPRI
jgi:hypothetical protein